MLMQLTSDTNEKNAQNERRDYLICRVGWHSWVYLDPSDAQLEEVRRLITHGRGSLGLSAYGISDHHVCDRICRFCHKGEARFEKFLDGLRSARGVTNDNE